MAATARQSVGRIDSGINVRRESARLSPHQRLVYQTGAINLHAEVNRQTL
jgi:hypothetical protein